MLSFTTNGNFIDFKYTEDQYPFYVHQVMKLHNTSRAITWAYSDNPDIIDFTIDDLSYNEIPITSIYFDGVQMSAQADFETGIKAMFPGYAGGSPSLGYKSYIAILSQSGTSDPIATVLENGLSGDIVWARSSIGYYVGTLSGAFTINKTVLPPFGVAGSVFLPIGNNVPLDYSYNVNKVDSDSVRLIVVQSSDFANVDLSTATNESVLVEIRVYD